MEQEMERLLCLKIASRGDLLLAGPAFRELRKARPEAHITLWVGESCEDVARHLPFFNEIQTLDDKSLLAGSFFAKATESIRLWGQMRKGRFSEIFIFHRDWRYAFLARLAGIPIRRGIQRNQWNKFLTHPHVPDPSEHHVLQYLALTGAPCPEFAERARSPFPTPHSPLPIPHSMEGVWQFAHGEKEAGLEKAATLGFNLSEGKWIGLGFGGGKNVKTRTELKTWPLENYREAASAMEQKGFKVVWLGDMEDALALGKKFTGVNLAGKLTVPETAAVMSACALVVSNDSLAMHLSEALGIPTLGLFGPTDPDHYRPLGKRSGELWAGRELPCSPCHDEGYFPPCRYQHRCMKDLTVESVLLKVVKMLAE